MTCWVEQHAHQLTFSVLITLKWNFPGYSSSVFCCAKEHVHLKPAFSLSFLYQSYRAHSLSFSLLHPHAHAMRRLRDYLTRLKELWHFQNLETNYRFIYDGWLCRESFQRSRWPGIVTVVFSALHKITWSVLWLFFAWLNIHVPIMLHTVLICCHIFGLVDR